MSHEKLPLLTPDMLARREVLDVFSVSPRPSALYSSAISVYVHSGSLRGHESLSAWVNTCFKFVMIVLVMII